MRAFLAAAGLAAMLALSACADDGMRAPAQTGSTSMGPVLVDARGMTLYTFDRDATGKSMCNGQCAANWPPLTAPAGATAGSGWAMVTRDPGMPPTFVPAAAGPWTVITRDDATRQWAYKGKPVYTWVRDQKPGDTNGEGAAGGAWHVAKP